LLLLEMRRHFHDVLEPIQELYTVAPESFLTR